MISFFKKKDDPIAEIQLKKYYVKIVFNGDQQIPYNFTNVVAENADDAVDQMKQYVAKNGFFGGMAHEDVLAKLSVIEVKEI